MPKGGWMHKENGVYKYSEILFDLKTEYNSDTGYKMVEPETTCWN